MRSFQSFDSLRGPVLPLQLQIGHKRMFAAFNHCDTFIAKSFPGKLEASLFSCSAGQTAPSKLVSGGVHKNHIKRLT
jgi:hypothetical protein